MNKAIIYVHGKGGSAEEAKRYRALCPQYDVFGLDYKGNTPWDTKDEIVSEYEKLNAKYDSIVVIANSIGAYYTMNALGEKRIERALFISPIVDMQRLIRDMMIWANVTEQELMEKKEIKTAFDETLSWDYLCYVRAHPIIWSVPTDILYARKDNLTSYDTISSFAGKINASLTIMENGEHWFHTGEQMAFLEGWLTKHMDDKLIQFYEIIKNDMDVKLATASGASVTMRTVSPVYYEGNILMFTSADSLKYQQLKQNPHCCIAAGGFFAEADAEFLGSTMLDENASLRDVYSEKFPGAFDEGIPFGGRYAEFILLKPVKIKGWAFENDIPIPGGIPTIPFELRLG